MDNCRILKTTNETFTEKIEDKQENEDLLKMDPAWSDAMEESCGSIGQMNVTIILFSSLNLIVQHEGWSSN